MLPSNKATWDIQQLLIVSDGVESASDSERSSVSDVEDAPATRSPELSDISKLLLKAKAAAEVCGCGLVVYSPLGDRPRLVRVTEWFNSSQFCKNSPPVSEEI